MTVSFNFIVINKVHFCKVSYNVGIINYDGSMLTYRPMNPLNVGGTTVAKISASKVTPKSPKAIRVPTNLNFFHFCEKKKIAFRLAHFLKLG